MRQVEMFSNTDCLRGVKVTCFGKIVKIIAREFSTLPYTLRDQPDQLTCTKEKHVSADHFRKFPFLCKNKKNMIELKYLQNYNSWKGDKSIWHMLPPLTTTNLRALQKVSMIYWY